MCPRFHTDYVKCRLVTTYVGPATQWLPHDLVNRSKLGHGNQGQPDDKSGLFLEDANIEQLNVGHVATWPTLSCSIFASSKNKPDLSSG